MSGPDDLVASEGVDEGSALATAEGLDTPAASGQGDAGPDPDAGLLGEPPRGAPVDEAQAAPPEDMETPDSRTAREQTGTGQQYSTGEG